MTCSFNFNRGAMKNILTENCSNWHEVCQFVGQKSAALNLKPMLPFSNVDECVFLQGCVSTIKPGEKNPKQTNKKKLPLIQCVYLHSQILCMVISEYCFLTHYICLKMIAKNAKRL